MFITTKSIPIDNYFLSVIGRMHSLISAHKITDEDLIELERFYNYINILLDKEKWNEEVIIN